MPQAYELVICKGLDIETGVCKQDSECGITNEHSQVACVIVIV